MLNQESAETSLVVPQVEPILGTYVALRVAQSTHDDIKNFCVNNNVQVNLSHFDRRLHCTLIYSRKYCPDLCVNPSQIYRAEFCGYDIFTNSTGDNNVLVMKIKSPQVYARHKQLMREYSATYDYEDFVPHLSISYNFTGDIKHLPDFDRELFLHEEYTENLSIGNG